MSKKLAVISLGCDKNRVDTEVMLHHLSGYGCVITDDYAEADAAVVNTCAFIESAREEAIDVILSLAEYKKTGRLKRLVVTGCLPQMHREELKAELPEVDALLGIDEYEKIGAALFGGQVEAPSFKRVLTTPPHYAYLKIADGCDNHCTFCTIPAIRGRYRSRGADSLMSEAASLVDSGVRELILVAQDVTRYGSDLGHTSLAELLERLNGLDGLDWIRLLYCYPERVDAALIRLLAGDNRVCRYIDMPMQHADDTVLKRMNRQSSHASLSGLIESIRAADPGIEIRSTFMVGFPGETDAQFQTLNRFVADFGLCSVGMFAYSAEEGTPAARLPNQVDEKIKLERISELSATVLKNNERRNKNRLGKTLSVLYEDIDYERNLFVGRLETAAPDVDPVVRFSGDFVDVGQRYPVTITGTDGYDLIGEISK